MITASYQVTAPRTVAVKFHEISARNRVWVRPTHMSICHADQRYYQGKRPQAILEKKFPMALIHEAVGVVVRDDSGAFQAGTPVAMIPNIPGKPIAGVYENYAPGFIIFSCRWFHARNRGFAGQTTGADSPGKPPYFPNRNDLGCVPRSFPLEDSSGHRPHHCRNLGRRVSRIHTRLGTARTSSRARDNSNRGESP